MSKFENYENLLKKVDDQFEKIYSAHKDQFACKKSCHQCCIPKLTVCTVEKEYILNFLHNNPSVIEKLKELERLDVYEGERCKFLDETGSCSIYEARPSVCRSHGAPLWFKLPGSEFDDEDYEQDVCFLNFKDTDIKSLSLDSFINIDTLNSILVTLNMLFENEGRHPTAERFELSIDGLGLNKETQNS